MNRLLPLVLGLVASIDAAALTKDELTVIWKSQPEHALVVNNIAPIAANRYCVAGSDLDTQAAKTTALIQTIDTAQVVPTWTTSAALTDKTLFQNRFTHCSAVSESVYGLEEVDTQPSSALSQTLIFVNRFDLQGRRLARKQLDIDAKKPWAINLASRGELLQILVGEQESKTKSSSGGMRLISMPFDLSTQKSIAIPNGSFFYPTQTQATDQGLFLVGPFAKNSQEEDSVLAAAKISPTGKYLWAQHLSIPANKAAYAFSNHTYQIQAAGIQSKELTSQVINTSGQVSTARISLQSTACKLLGLADTVRAFTLDCSKPPQVMATDLTTGSVTLVKKLDQKPVASFDLPEAIVIVTSSKTDSAEYHFQWIQK